VGAGGQVLQSKMSIGEFGYIAILMDTEGNTIGLHSRK
ncbi:MAG: VOC family protein, partial [Bacteroidota bacterium]